MISRRNQGGNAIVIILIGVFLFGALAYTFMKGGRQGTGNMNTQQAKILAGEILDYSQTVEKAVNKLRAQGCSESQLNFDDSDATTSGYENGGAPVDKSCNVFDVAGGKMTYQRPPASALIPQSQTSSYTYLGRTYNEYKIPSAVCVPGVGTCDSTDKTKDLVIGVEYLKREVCLQLNILINLASVPPTTGTTCSPLADTERYAGSFVNAGYYGCGSVPVECMHSARTGYTFYYLMLPRP